jgi:hypothetical protein
MKITEKMLLDNYVGITNGIDSISDINGVKIFWNYRTGRTDDGYNCVTDRKNATEISLENDRYGKIDLDDDCENHPALSKIILLYQKLFGTHI